VDTVVEQLISLIADGHLKPGDRLPSERDLALRLQVGRSTVREALKTLVAMGLVEGGAGHGTFIRQPDTRSAIPPALLSLLLDRTLTNQLLEARRIVEPEIMSLAVERATDDDLAEMREILARCEQAIADGRPVFRLSPEFHRAVARAAHNQVLLTFMDSILTQFIERGVLLENKPGFVQWELESHRAVFECIVARDLVKGREIMARHIEESYDAFVELGPVTQPNGTVQQS